MASEVTGAVGRHGLTIHALPTTGRRTDVEAFVNVISYLHIDPGHSAFSAGPAPTPNPGFF